MKILYKFIVTFFIITWLGFSSTYAVEFISGENIKITEENKWDLVITWERVDIETKINNDVIIAAWEIRVEQAIEQDFMFAAWEVRIEEKISDDVRWMAGLVIIENDVEWDVILAAWEVRISKEATIKWDLIIASGRLEIDGNILGDVKMIWEELELNGVIHWNADIILDTFSNTTNSGTILWNLNYRSEEKNILLEQSVIGTVFYEASVFKKQFKKDFKDVLFSTIILKILFVFVFSTFMYFFFVRFFKRSAEILNEQTWKSFLYGIMTLLLVPIFIILFFISVIWIPVWLLLLFWYILILIFINIINTTIISSWIISKYKFFNNIYLKILLIALFSIIFVLVNGLGIIVWFFTIWTVIILKKEILAIIRNQYK